MKTKRKTRGAKPNRQRRFAEARGYTASEAQLAEIMLVECCLLENAKAINELAGRVQRCCNNLNDLRRRIREAA